MNPPRATGWRRGVPRPLRHVYRTVRWVCRRRWLVIQARRRVAADPRSRLEAAAVFSAVYEANVWGGVPGSFYSGGGSDEVFVAPYRDLLRAFVKRERFGDRDVTIVDLGCGDFRVGSQLVGPGVRYVGVDVVPALVERNRREFAGAGVTFECLDLVRDELPEGDVCLVRQVLQHLSNAEIALILPKLETYPHVFITEHYPMSDEGVVPNLDKPHGHEIRLAYGSAVYLDRPPFRLDGVELVQVTPHDGWGELRTFHLGRQPLR